MSAFRWSAAMAVLVLAGCAEMPKGAPSTAPLVGTRWVAAPGDSSDRRQVARLEFLADGKLGGYTGCNMLSGSWTQEGAAVKLGPVATTKRACVGPEMEVERRFLSAMGDKSRVLRDDGKLTLEADGARFEFVAAPPGY